VQIPLSIVSMPHRSLTWINMKNSLLAGVILALCAPLNALGAAPISSTLQRAAVAQNGYFVVLHSAQDLSQISATKTGTEKTSAVFNALHGQKQALIDFAKQYALKDAEYFWLTNAIFVPTAPSAEGLSRLANDARVQAIAANPTAHFDAPLLEFSASKTVTAATPGQTLIGSPQLWALGIRGQGVVVAGEDTGYAWTHPALKSSYRGWDGSAANHNYNWYDGVIASVSASGGSCGLNVQQPCDDGSHGTHTMGTMIGDDGAAEQIGAAPGARWIGCRNMDVGDGRPVTYLRCMQWMLAPTDLAGNNPNPALAPDVVNNSWGCPPSELCTAPEFGLLEGAVNALRSAGILFVAAAGNSGSACSTVADPPSFFAGTFTVGNVTLSNVMSGSSSRGPVTADGSNRSKPDVSAPGTSIRSSVPASGYGNLSGTSMASPHTAGAAALLIGAFPNLRRNPAAVEQLLRDSAVPVNALTQSCGGIAANIYPNNVAGFGRIDVYAAYQLALVRFGGLIFSSGFE
jgi:serine protease AprX